MKTARVLLIAILLVVFSLSIFAACSNTYTMTIVSAGTGVASQTVSSGAQSIRSGDKVKSGTQVDIVWSAASGYTANLYINDAKTDFTSPKTITIEGDTKIEIKAERIKHQVTIVDRATGISTQTVVEKSTNLTVNSGDNVTGGTELLISWTTTVDFVGVLYVNDQALENATSPTTVVVNIDTKIEIRPVYIDYTVTIVDAPAGVSNLSVKNGEVEIKNGDKVHSGSNLDISWTLSINYSVELYINDQKQTLTENSKSIAVTSDTTIQLKTVLRQCLVTILEKPTGVTTANFKIGEVNVVSGDIVDSGSKIVVTWTADSKYVVELFVDGTKISGDSTTGIEVTVVDDVEFELKATLKQFKVEIETVSEGITSSAYYIKEEVFDNLIVSGDLYRVNSTITVVWSTQAGYTAQLTVNGVAKSSTSPAIFTLTEDVKIKIVVTKHFEKTFNVVASSLPSSLVAGGTFTGHYNGLAGGASITPNVELEIVLNRQTTDTKYATVYNISLLSGTTGGAMHLIYCPDGSTNYHDAINNWETLGETKLAAAPVATPFIDLMLEYSGEYVGFWNDISGNTLSAISGNDKTLETKNNFQFVAENAGTYLITMNVLVLIDGELEVAYTYGILVNVT